MPADSRRGATADVRDSAVDGLVLYSLSGDDRALPAVRLRHLPVVVIDSPLDPGEGYGYVGVDDVAVGRTAMEHLLDLGHRRVGVISLRLSAQHRTGAVSIDQQRRAVSEVPRRRLLGARDVCEQAGIVWRGVPVVQAGLSSVAAGRAAAAALLDAHPATTAVFAMSDALGLGVVAEAAARGLDVPRDLSVVGVDGTAPAAAGLTSIWQPHQEKGRVAASLLLDSLSSGGALAGPVVLSIRLVEATSTAAAPSDRNVR